jgi:hypothetical protein
MRHWRHPGLSSSHLTFRLRHVQHPVNVLLCFRGLYPDREWSDMAKSAAQAVKCGFVEGGEFAFTAQKRAGDMKGNS